MMVWEMIHEMNIPDIFDIPEQIIIIIIKTISFINAMLEIITWNNPIAKFYVIEK